MIIDGLTIDYASLFTIIGIYYLFIHDMPSYIERIVWMVLVGFIVGMIIGPAFTYAPVETYQL